MIIYDNDNLLLRIRYEGDSDDDDFNLLTIKKDIINIKIKGIDNIEGFNIRKIILSIY